MRFKFATISPVKLICPLVAVASGWLMLPSLSHAADMTARQVTELLYNANENAPPDLSGLNLQNLDLAQLDFKRATLSQSDLFGTDLTGSNLRDVDLRAARLDRVTLIRSNFDGADLTGVTLLRPTSFSSLTENLAEASSFKGVQMANAKAFGQFNGFNFEGANLKNTTFAPFNETGFIEHIWRTKLESANLAETNLENADMTYVSARYANFRNANLKNVSFRFADLSQAKFAGADLSNVDFTGADLDETDFRDAKGLDAARGLDKTVNRSKALF